MGLAVSGLSEGGGRHGADIILAGIFRRRMQHGGEGGVLGIFVADVPKEGCGVIGQGVAVGNGLRAGYDVVHTSLYPQKGGGQGEAHANNRQDQNTEALDDAKNARDDRDFFVVLDILHILDLLSLFFGRRNV